MSKKFLTDVIAKSADMPAFIAVVQEAAKLAFV